MVENAFATVPTMDPRPVDTLAQRLQVAFDDSGVSVAQVAAACGITPQAIYKWLKGTSDDLAGQQLAKVCDLTGFDPAWIEFGTGPRIRAYARTERAATVLKAMERLTDVQAAALEQMAIALAGSDGVEPNGKRAA